MTAQQMTEARAWVADCAWADLDADQAAGLTDDQVARGVARHYEGGIAQFIADAG